MTCRFLTVLQRHEFHGNLVIIAIGIRTAQCAQGECTRRCGERTGYSDTLGDARRAKQLDLNVLGTRIGIGDAYRHCRQPHYAANGVVAAKGKE